MKNILVSLLLGAGLVCSQAAEGKWLTDFAKAKELAKKENKLLLMDFTGSDWCPPCKALHKNVLATPDFIKFADQNLVLLEVDFPRSKPQSAELKKANQALQKEFSIEGYPTVIILDANGKQLSKDVGYSGADAKSYIAKIQKLSKK